MDSPLPPPPRIRSMVLTDTSTAAPSPNGTSRARHLLQHNRGDQVRLSTDQHGNTFATATVTTPDGDQLRHDCFFCKERILFKGLSHFHDACKTVYHRQCFQQVSLCSSITTTVTDIISHL